MNKIILLILISMVSFACCPLMGLIQMGIEDIQNMVSDLIEQDQATFQEDLQIDEMDPTETEAASPFVGTISPCEGVYEKYPHDPSLGEISEAYIGSWHADYSMSDAYKERFVLFPSGNYLFFPDQYECRNTFKTCVPSPIEDGLWGVQGQVMNFARGGDMKDIVSRSITDVVPSSIDESPYPYKTTIDGLKFWLWSKETDYWDPETGEYCGW